MRSNFSSFEILSDSMILSNSAYSPCDSLSNG